MKQIFSILSAIAIAVVMTGCSGSGSTASSDDMFGGIPGTLSGYEEKYDALTAEMSSSNYEKKQAELKKLKEETLSRLESDGQALNGKELATSVDESMLKIESPLTWVFKNVFSNVKAVEFGVDGKIVAAADINLPIKPADLKGRKMLGGRSSVITAKLPVHLEFMDKDGNVVDTRTIGNLIADNNGEEAVVKAGTAIEFSGSIPVTSRLLNVDKAVLTIDPSKAYTSESMPE